jgi:hypothetical protein
LWETLSDEVWGGNLAGLEFSGKIFCVADAIISVTFCETEVASATMLLYELGAKSAIVILGRMNGIMDAKFAGE